jgi:hypothetical protein
VFVRPKGPTLAVLTAGSLFGENALGCNPDVVSCRRQAAAGGSSSDLDNNDVEALDFDHRQAHAKQLFRHQMEHVDAIWIVPTLFCIPLATACGPAALLGGLKCCAAWPPT